MSRRSKQEREQDYKDSLESLRQLLRPGVTVYTALKSVSRSGACRHISLYIPHKDTDWRSLQIINISWRVSCILGYSLANDGSLIVSGCGMDMGFHLVYSLGSVLYPKGFRCAGEKCRSNYHFNDPDDKRDGKHWHIGDGGYALNQAWL
jgi:hypothetical protein